MVNILTIITLSNLEIRGVSFLNLAKTQRKIPFHSYQFTKATNIGNSSIVGLFYLYIHCQYT